MNIIFETILRNLASQIRSKIELEAVRDKNPDSLLGYCAIASAMLHDLLTYEGIKAEIHLSDNITGCHCFCIVEDHVVDVTATQFPEFSNTPIVIMHHREAEQHWFYETHRVFRNGKALAKYQAKNGWPEHQRVSI